MKTKEKKKRKWKMIAGIMLVIQLLLSLATVGVVLWLNIVPTLYVILLGLILLLLLIIEYCLFYFGKKKKGKKKTGCYVRRTLGVILILACVIVCGGGEPTLKKRSRYNSILSVGRLRVMTISSAPANIAMKKSVWTNWN